MEQNKNIGWDFVEEEHEENEEIFNIDEETIDLMLEKLNLYDYFMEYENLNLISAGQDRYKIHCPFKDHLDQTAPSFTVYEDTHSFFCFGCQRGGTILQWLIDPQGKNMHFIEAVKFLGSITGISPYSDPIIALERLEEKIKKELYSIDDTNELSRDKFNLIISRLGYQHLKDSNFDKEEIKFIEQLYKHLDTILLNFSSYEHKTEEMKNRFVTKIHQRKGLQKNASPI